MGKNNIPPYLCLKHRGSSSDTSEPISIIRRFFLNFLAVPHGMGNHHSPTRDQTVPPAREVQSLNHWTPRKSLS